MATPELKRVRSVEVVGLFGLYNHKIPLNKESRVTIIHGPNGVGKTMLLGMLSALFNGQYSELIQAPFKSLQINLDDGYVLTIRRSEREANDTDRKTGSLKQIKLTAEIGKVGELIEFELGSTVSSDDTERVVAASFPYLRRINSEIWQDERDGEIISREELEHRYLSRALREKLGRMSEPLELKQIRSSVKVYFIEAQRLLQLSLQEEDVRRLRRMYGHSRMVPTVEQYSQELRDKIANSLATYAGESQALDQTFPRRLVELRESLSPEDLREKLDELERTRKTISDMGLLVASQAYPVSLTELDNLDESKRGVMTLYVQDTTRKLGMLESISDRIKLFLASINGKFRNKRVSVSREFGILVTGLDGNEINVNALSSGEQHEIVMLYDLLFRIDPNTLVLIDEPELSLHVMWQKRFLPELLAITQEAEFDVIVATHSPFIVGDSTDLMIALDADADADVGLDLEVKTSEKAS